MDIDEIFSRYEISTQAQGYQKKTADHVKACVRLFLNFLGEPRPVDTISADDFTRFLADLRSKNVWAGTARAGTRKLSSTSVNTYARAIKSFWSWLQREGIIESNPLSAVHAPKKAGTLPKVYTEKQLAAVFEAASTSSRERTIIELILDSGVRLAELAGLKVDNIDLASGKIKIMGKGGKERYVYISPVAAQSVTAYLTKQRPEPQGEDVLFLTVDGQPLKAARIQKVLDLIGKRVGISERLSPHKLRHTYATLSLKYGNNIEYIRATLGHTDIKTTSESYLHAADADIAAAHARSSPLTHLLKPHQLESDHPANNIPVDTRPDKGLKKKFLEQETEVTVNPAPYDPLTSGAAPEICRYFTMSIRSSQMVIDTIEVYSSDPTVPYKLMLFADKPPEEDYDLQREDLIGMKATTKRTYMFAPENGLYYRDYDQQNKLHGGICIGQRPMRFDLSDSDNRQEATSYYQKEVTFKITLRYSLKLSK